jgi:hypothetical protein
MNVDLHTVIPALITRRIMGASWTMTAYAALGGLFPDAVSAVEHIFYGLGIIDHKWIWRNWFHFFDQGAFIAITTALGVSLVASAARESLRPFFAGLCFAMGFLLHVSIDYLWHPPGGGWYWWGFYVDMATKIVLLGWFIVGWIRSGSDLKSFIKTF